jgi:hypothetical protein
MSLLESVELDGSSGGGDIARVEDMPRLRVLTVTNREQLFYPYLPIACDTAAVWPQLEEFDIELIDGLIDTGRPHNSNIKAFLAAHPHVKVIHIRSEESAIGFFHELSKDLRQAFIRCGWWQGACSLSSALLREQEDAAATISFFQGLIEDHPSSAAAICATALLDAQLGALFPHIINYIHTHMLAQAVADPDARTILDNVVSYVESLVRLDRDALNLSQRPTLFHVAVSARSVALAEFAAANKFYIHDAAVVENVCVTPLQFLLLSFAKAESVDERQVLSDIMGSSFACLYSCRLICLPSNSIHICRCVPLERSEHGRQ